MHASDLAWILSWLHRMAHGSLALDALILLFVVYQLVAYIIRIFECTQNINSCSL